MLRINKRLFDLVVLLLISPIAIPLIIFISILVYLAMGLPIFFIQDRTGLKGSVFMIYKFRTMTLNNQEKNEDDSTNRITRLGFILRRFSLDELPQIYNILIGNMSFVGPRPLLIEYLEKYSTDQIRRLDILPGLTGWAQINGRNSISWDEKFRLDTWYVDNQSFLLDLKILMNTFLTVFKKSGVNKSEGITMSKFGD